MSGIPQALRACALWLLTTRTGTWVPLSLLVAKLAQPVPRVQHACQQLVEEGLALRCDVAGAAYYGLRVEGVPPPDPPAPPPLPEPASIEPGNPSNPSNPTAPPKAQQYYHHEVYPQ